MIDSYSTRRDCASSHTPEFLSGPRSAHSRYGTAAGYTMTSYNSEKGTVVTLRLYAQSYLDPVFL